MNLIEAQKIVEQKDKNRSKLLGQKEMLMEGLKDLGFKNMGEAKKTRTAIKDEVIKMEKHYKSGETKFKNEYAHLLQ